MFSNNSTKSMYEFLLKEASAPYYEILRGWIHYGVLDDTYNEFMVEERPIPANKNAREDLNDVYWEQKYTLRSSWVPSFLEPHKNKVFLAGKYLNVLRECGKLPNESKPTDLDSAKQIDGAQLTLSHGSTLDAGLVSEIDAAHLKANKSLLDMLFKDENLINRLKSVKNMFLLGQSDYLTHFLDLAMPELRKQKSLISASKLTSLFELVIRSSSSVVSNDEYATSFSVEMCNCSLFDQLIKINSIVGIDMRKHRENLSSGRIFKVTESLASAKDLFESQTPQSHLLGNH